MTDNIDRAADPDSAPDPTVGAAVRVFPGPMLMANRWSLHGGKRQFRRRRRLRSGHRDPAGGTLDSRAHFARYRFTAHQKRIPTHSCCLYRAPIHGRRAATGSLSHDSTAFIHRGGRDRQRGQPR